MRMPNPATEPPASRSDAAGVVAPARIVDREREQRFVARMHRMRTLGLGLGFFSVASVLYIRGAPWFVWALLFAHGFAWPHVAWLAASRSAHPSAFERISLFVDSALGGAWIALMHFNLLPSVLIATMLIVDKVGLAGFRFALRTTAALVVACVVTSAALGFPVDLETPMSVVIACVPFLVAYPLAIAGVMHSLASRGARQNRWLAHVSATDEVTGLPNRRQGLLAAAQTLAYQRRHGGAAVLVVIDIDRFKQINDRYGHPAGDDVLRHVAKTLRECSRAIDTPARYAGDEFLLVLPATPLEGATEMMKRIRSEVAAASFDTAPGLRCTISLGAAEAHTDMADVEDWIQQADAALYEAKARGRDQLVCAPRVVATTQPGSAAAGRAA
jgi:diguanylate cyclase